MSDVHTKHKNLPAGELCERRVGWEEAYVAGSTMMGAGVERGR